MVIRAFRPPDRGLARRDSGGVALVANRFGRVHFLVRSFALYLAGYAATRIVASLTGRKDPQIVVVDEVLG